MLDLSDFDVARALADQFALEMAARREGYGSFAALCREKGLDHEAAAAELRKKHSGDNDPP